MANKDIFDKMANSYDSEDRLEVGSHIIREAQKHVAQLETKNTLIDFGCGTGEIGLNFIQDFNQVLFLDVSENMLNVVEEKLAAAVIKNGKTMLIDEISNFRVEADCIIVSQVLLHIPDTEAVLTSLFHMLKTEGSLLIVDFDKNELVQSALVHNGFDQNKLADQLKKLGFSKVHSEIFFERDQLFMGQAADRKSVV